MKTTTLSLPELGLIAGTRVALGVGIGLLLSEKLPRDTRRGAAFALLAVGILSTVPLAIAALGELGCDDENPAAI